MTNNRFAASTMRALAAVAALAALSACATATPYQPRLAQQAVAGGFSEQRIEPNRFRVTFAGNSLTSRETVESYLLFRAAELTQAQGYDWFSIADRQTDRRTQTYLQTDPFYNSWYGSHFGHFAPTWRYHGGHGWNTWDSHMGGPFFANRIDVRTIQKFEATAEIVMARGAKPLDDPAAFEARAVLENLGPRIQRPAPH
ncbi:CC0125/CC1285 family lipoprotein [Phenylobacterium aquaticum]|uniref:CC0125/CC1285 family lipoprotein n=1 Tax=Phenylobacterium aquaticum TaxID=1763816 RepID=UPI001F5CCEE0|nr:hypothetical protein [Phenylobacterium aquaticum]MCI3130778.1 hypothetical protein [Phenylobacterium aquaticum]